MTKLQRVIGQLLTEIHQICAENDIEYVLHPKLTLFLMSGKGIPEHDDCRCVYMTAPNFQRFLKICGASLPKSRSLESLSTNPWYPEFYSARYGDTETFYMNINEGRNYVNHGIFIRIEILRAYPPNAMAKKLITMLELGWRANTYQYAMEGYGKWLVSKFLVRCLLLSGRKPVGGRLLKLAMRAYQCDNASVIVRKGTKNQIYKKEIFDRVQLLETDAGSFLIPLDWEGYVRAGLGKNTLKILETPDTPRLTVLENPYISGEKFLEACPHMDSFFKARLRIGGKRRKLRRLMDYRQYCWDMVNMAGDKYRLQSYYEKNRKRILNLAGAKNYDRLMTLFGPYIKAQKKYARYHQTFSLDREIDRIYYETLSMRGQGKFAARMKRYLRGGVK